MTQSLNQAIKSFGPESTKYDQKLTLTIQLTVRKADDVGTGIRARLGVVSVLYRVKEKD